jgi:N utilization substance protein B
VSDASPRVEARRRAREAALQMLYQWEMSGLDVADVRPAYRLVRSVPLDPESEAFAEHLLHGTAAGLQRIDAIVEAHSEHWRLERMAAVDRMVLRMATFELLDGAEPPTVVINEALEVARTFSTEAAVKFVNGVLDAVAKDLARERG